MRVHEHGEMNSGHRRQDTIMKNGVNSEYQPIRDKNEMSLAGFQLAGMVE